MVTQMLGLELASKVRGSAHFSMARRSDKPCSIVYMLFCCTPHMLPHQTQLDEAQLSSACHARSTHSAWQLACCIWHRLHPTLTPLPLPCTITQLKLGLRHGRGSA